MIGGLILPCYSCLCGWAKDYLLFGSCPDDATLEALRFAPPAEEEAEKPQPAGKGKKKRSAPATTARAEAAEKAGKKTRKK